MPDIDITNETKTKPEPDSEDRDFETFSKDIKLKTAEAKQKKMFSINELRTIITFMVISYILIICSIMVISYGALIGVNNKDMDYYIKKYQMALMFILGIGAILIGIANLYTRKKIKLGDKWNGVLHFYAISLLTTILVTQLCLETYYLSPILRMLAYSLVLLVFGLIIGLLTYKAMRSIKLQSMKT